MYFQGPWWLAAQAVADVVVSLLLLNPEEKLVEEKGPLIQGMTPCLKPIVNVRFANKLTRQQKISLPLCYLSLLRVPFLMCWVCLSLIKENFSCNYTNGGGGGILVSFSTMKLFLRSISASLRSHTWGPDCNTFKRAVLWQSSSFCLILPMTRLQLLWNLK